MASPLLSERVCASILWSLCSEEDKMHGKAVVACLQRQQLIINLAGEETVYSFADVVDVANYDARGMMDDFFPRYPYKTTRNSWKYFKAWVTDGTGQLYQEFCIKWIEVAQRFLGKCSSCRACSQRPTPEKLLQVFGTFCPYYIGERPRYMYSGDDQMVSESELYPVAGGLVMEEAGPLVKDEIPDAPSEFAWRLTQYEVGGPSGVNKGDQAEEAHLMALRCVTTLGCMDYFDSLLCYWDASSCSHRVQGSTICQGVVDRFDLWSILPSKHSFMDRTAHQLDKIWSSQ